MSLEARRNRAIRNIAEYRESFARKVREGSGRIKVALIERVSALGSMETPRLFNSVREANRFLISIERGEMPAMPER